MSVLNVARPEWMSEELEMVSDASRKFFERECVPHYDEWEENGQVDREVWNKDAPR